MLHDVHTQHISITACIRLELVKCPVGALSHPVGIAVRVEKRLEKRFDDIAQCVVDHAVPKRRRTNNATLGLVDDKMPVRAGVIGILLQLSLQSQQAIRYLELESRCRMPPAFPARRFVVR